MMKNKRVIFGSSVEYYDPSMGLKEWDRPTIEFDIGDDEDFLEYLHLAKAIIKTFYGAGSKITVNPEYAHLVEPPIPVDEKISGMKLIIEMSNTKQLLERQRGQVERMNNPELTKLFEEKLKSFQ